MDWRSVNIGPNVVFREFSFENFISHLFLFFLLLYFFISMILTHILPRTCLYHQKNVRKEYIRNDQQLENTQSACVKSSNRWLY